MSYYKEIEQLLAGVHPEVKDLLDPAKQKRRFPKTELAGFLKKKKIRAKINGEIPEAITKLAKSKEDRVLVPTETLRTFFTDQDIWDLVPDRIRKALFSQQ